MLEWEFFKLVTVSCQPGPHVSLSPTLPHHIPAGPAVGQSGKLPGCEDSRPGSDPVSY